MFRKIRKKDTKPNLSSPIEFMVTIKMIGGCWSSSCRYNTCKSKFSSSWNALKDVNITHPLHKPQTNWQSNMNKIRLLPKSYHATKIMFVRSIDKKISKPNVGMDEPISISVPTCHYCKRNAHCFTRIMLPISSAFALQATNKNSTAENSFTILLFFGIINSHPTGKSKKKLLESHRSIFIPVHFFCYNTK